MLITNLKLINFRNYEELNINFNKNINIFYGNNAQGKTNIIESIFLCAIGKSFRTNRDKELIQFNKNFLNIEIFLFEKDLPF
jgi:DNA replication and repair protein RecF